MKKIFITLIALILCGTEYANSQATMGFRGFVDATYTVGVGERGNGYDRAGIMTSYGCQVLPQLFVGGGAGINYYGDSQIGLPVFAHVRGDVREGSTPFADIRVGYSFKNFEGFYLNPAIGYRFRLNDNMGLSLGFGYTMQYAGLGGHGKENCGGMDFRVGIDF